MNPPATDDIVARLLTLAAPAEIGDAPLDGERAAALANEAAEEIRSLRRRIDGLEMRLNSLQSMNMWPAQ
jgi:hypothetical protein